MLFNNFGSVKLFGFIELLLEAPELELPLLEDVVVEPFWLFRVKFWNELVTGTSAELVMSFILLVLLLPMLLLLAVLLLLLLLLLFKFLFVFVLDELPLEFCGLNCEILKLDGW